MLLSSDFSSVSVLVRRSVKGNCFSQNLFRPASPSVLTSAASSVRLVTFDHSLSQSSLLLTQLILELSVTTEKSLQVPSMNSTLISKIHDPSELPHESVSALSYPNKSHMEVQVIILIYDTVQHSSLSVQLVLVIL